MAEAGELRGVRGTRRLRGKIVNTCSHSRRADAVSKGGPRRSRTLAAGLALGLIGSVGLAASAIADAMPGFSFDAAKLEEEMTACMGRHLDAGHVLMGWVKVSTGEARQWRCGSLQHMLGPEERDGEGHDPFADVDGFMHCVDRVVSYGFPRKASNPALEVSILQYHGTKRQARVVFDPETGDIRTIFTVPHDDDWSECATWTP